MMRTQDEVRQQRERIANLIKSKFYPNSEKITKENMKEFKEPNFGYLCGLAQALTWMLEETDELSVP
jgi:hypothetical protein